MMLPLINTISVPTLQGVPFPDEEFEPVRLSDPQELRNLLTAEEAARRTLPFIDSRAAHWRYYLFGCPGRQFNNGSRLFRVLRNTPRSSSGIGRRQYIALMSDGRRSVARFRRRLARNWRIAYGSATKAFWDPSIDPPSAALRQAAREYVLRNAYRNFFERDGVRSRLKQVFRARLIGLRRGLADHIIRNQYDLEQAAFTAASSRALEDDDRLLFFSWALLQAYFGIADDGRFEGVEDADDADTENKVADDEYYRTCARAALKLLTKIGTPAELGQKRCDLIRTKLKAALRHRAYYQPPVWVPKFKNDGRRRRIFASLRLRAYARLLRDTR
jgi:hypothetical protein